MIRQTRNINGIVINESEHTISQHADDTELMLNGDEKNSFEEAMKTTDDFENKSGLFLNADKCDMARKQT